MPFTPYHKETTRFLVSGNSCYATKGAAKAAITRAYNDGKIDDVNDYAVADSVEFRNSIEKSVTRRNLMSGEEIQVAVNTPVYLDPSCESYWSM